MDEIFDSSVRSLGDLAGVFEFEGESGYFYLYETVGREGQKVIASLHVLSGAPDFAATDIAVRWDADEHRVGLFIRGVLWATFDTRSRASSGGHYRPGTSPSLPPDAAGCWA